MNVRRVVMAVVVSAALTGVLAVPGVRARGPAGATPWIVSLGDSYISGEAGRWAGNSDAGSSSVDAGGPGAYYDNANHTAETISGCHRSTAAEINIGSGVSSLNLACSGSQTSTFTATDGSFKPGLDFADGPTGKGQALLLQQFATTHRVQMIEVSVGGNNFGFADIVQRCVTDFLLSPSWWPNYCHDDGPVTAHFTASNVSAQTAAIAGALANVRTAMSNAGYSNGQYTVVVQTYPSPLPRGSGFRYAQSGFTRQSTGGCGFWNRDADWANDTALVTINGAVRNAAASAGALVLDVTGAFNGRRLCESSVNLIERSGRSNWTASGASDATEWIDQIRTLSTIFGPYQIQESLHPNWWGELALRNCTRQVFNGGSPRGGSCTHGTGLDALGEPNMTLA